ncbi:Eco29kI restriction endonuclease [Thermomonospora echinospora]|uniref:Eco29kI restriction endonuclease n=1 Tax=Thermomonospora echinospora TaxID=1992 RepID=A0A1H6DXX5_9ACTN|nr:Eco29kI family restriction endonuclease [Thermomonospora echinospora]SEG90200.1 Eco29kI restriction endonuclease [Thermomonospora echinospora]
MPPYTPEYYDPMSTDHITSMICLNLEDQPVTPLWPEIPRFDGSGLYAIYYIGSSIELYAPLSSYKIPVYVGQARSHNSATGKGVRERDPLWRRIRDHSKSIEGAGLPLHEFGVRLLRLPDVHIDLGENGLRVNYQPVWNAVLTGFGSHEQGSSTRQSSRSKWDTVHEGRNRTFGATKHDKDVLLAKARKHIDQQIADYSQVPWHQD